MKYKGVYFPEEHAGSIHKARQLNQYLAVWTPKVTDGAALSSHMIACWPDKLVGRPSTLTLVDA